MATSGPPLPPRPDAGVAPIGPAPPQRRGANPLIIVAIVVASMVVVAVVALILVAAVVRSAQDEFGYIDYCLKHQRDPACSISVTPSP